MTRWNARQREKSRHWEPPTRARRVFEAAGRKVPSPHEPCALRASETITPGATRQRRSSLHSTPPCAHTFAHALQRRSSLHSTPPVTHVWGHNERARKRQLAPLHWGTTRELARESSLRSTPELARERELHSIGARRESSQARSTPCAHTFAHAPHAMTSLVTGSLPHEPGECLRPPADTTRWNSHQREKSRHWEPPTRARRVSEAAGRYNSLELAPTRKVSSLGTSHTSQTSV